MVFACSYGAQVKSFKQKKVKNLCPFKNILYTIAIRVYGIH